MRYIFAVLIAAAFAAADSATFYQFPDAGGVMPVENQDIEMVAETVLIAPTGDMLALGTPEMEVRCVFHLRNLTDVPHEITAGFPFESFHGDENYLRRDGYNIRHTIEDMEDDEAWDIKEMVPEYLGFRAFTDDREYPVRYQRGRYNEDLRKVFWPLVATWQMRFEPGETIRLQNSYRTGWHYSSYTDYRSEFTYVVRSGKLWHGSIGSAVIRVTLPEEYGLGFLSDTTCNWTGWTGSPEIDFRTGTLTWRYSDLLPEEDISVTSRGYNYIDLADFLSRIEYGGTTVFSADGPVEDWYERDLLVRAMNETAGWRCNPPAETVLRLLENCVYRMAAEEMPNDRLRGMLYVRDPNPLDQNMLANIEDLRDQLADYRDAMESAGYGFMLPMISRRNSWDEPLLGMYASVPSLQVRHLAALECYTSALEGKAIDDPALQALYMLSGWYIPGAESPVLRRYSMVNRPTLAEAPSFLDSAVNAYWRESGGCGIPLIGAEPLEEPGRLPLVDLSIEASSTLLPQSGNGYGTENLMDSDPATAWVEGDQGHGHGETLTLETESDCTASGLLLLNGHCRDYDTWQENTRIHRLLLTLNGEPVMTAGLLDVMGAQYVGFPEPVTLSHGDRLKLEVVQVYPGSIHPDAALSELSMVLQGN